MVIVSGHDRAQEFLETLLQVPVFIRSFRRTQRSRAGIELSAGGGHGGGPIHCIVHKSGGLVR